MPMRGAGEKGSFRGDAARNGVPHSDGRGPRGETRQRQGHYPCDSERKRERGQYNIKRERQREGGGGVKTAKLTRLFCWWYDREESVGSNSSRAAIDRPSWDRLTNR